MSMPAHWLKRTPLAYLLWPISVLFGVLSALRRAFYRLGIFNIWRSPVPVVVVGNIVAGGTGKTPLLLAMIQCLQAEGYQVGVVSRGYKSKASNAHGGLPQLLAADSNPAEVGDEPAMIFEQTQVPVCVCADRVAAVKHLLKQSAVDVVLSDDGLQHYALHRDIEIAVVDAAIEHGNGFLIPAGPLREKPARLNSVDFVAFNQTDSAVAVTSLPSAHYPPSKRQFIPVGSKDTATALVTFPFQLSITAMCRLDGLEEKSLEDFTGMRCHGVAGIGNPQRFFNALTDAGVVIEPASLDDHHVFYADEFKQWQDFPILMTAKDAVKCRHLEIDQSKVWYAKTSVELPNVFISNLLLQLSSRCITPHDNKP